MNHEQAISLKNQTPEGIPLEATFLPDKGMNLISYRRGEVEIIDQSTRPDFERRFAGLGPIIGPHFHHRKPHLIPDISNEEQFPHIAICREEKRSDPFSHGVGRYAPWSAEATENSIHAALSGKETWNDVPLAAIEGQDFQMHFDVELTPAGLQLHLSVVSEADSIVGIHYYYRLPQERGTVRSQVQNAYIVNDVKKPLPSDWSFDSRHILTYELNQDTDFTFFPYPNPLKGEIILNTTEYQLVTTYDNDSQENSWQLWHPHGASFVCIEPVSSQDPRHPNLTVSSIKIRLEILECV
ncbi:MAG: hypothetical protein WB791_05050 [Waddliaceae bacterium]